LKDIETRFQRQDARFQREVNDAREALKTRLDSLENFMRSETASLVNRINAEAAERNAQFEAEQRERTEALNALAGNLAAAEKEFERRVNTLSNTLDTTGQEIRKLMQTETNNLNNKIDEKYEAALNVLSETASQIRHDMVYRSMISSMFMEMGAKLNNQWMEDPVEVIVGKSPPNTSENQEHHQPDEEKLT
jgi:light-regulated signal transduction histidine kinase (bacteriophytochrome)